MAPARRAAPVVWINGFPGSGKLTVATAVAAVDKTAVVLDNHKLIDPVEARFERTHPRYQHERRLFRQAALDRHVRDPGMLSRLVVFTGKTSPLFFFLPVPYRFFLVFFFFFLVCSLRN
jgi:hypothetical protein